MNFLFPIQLVHPWAIVPPQQHHQPSIDAWVDKGNHYEFVVRCHGYNAPGIKMKIDEGQQTLHIKGISCHHHHSATSRSESVSEFSQEIVLPHDAVALSLYAQMFDGYIVITVNKQSTFIPVE